MQVPGPCPASLAHPKSANKPKPSLEVEATGQDILPSPIQTPKSCKIVYRPDRRLSVMSLREGRNRLFGLYSRSSRVRWTSGA